MALYHSEGRLSLSLPFPSLPSFVCPWMKKSTTIKSRTQKKKVYVSWHGLQLLRHKWKRCRRSEFSRLFFTLFDIQSARFLLGSSSWDLVPLCLDAHGSCCSFTRLSFILVGLIFTLFVRVYMLAVASLMTPFLPSVAISCSSLSSGRKKKKRKKVNLNRSNTRLQRIFFLFVPTRHFRLLFCAIFLHLSSYLSSQTKKKSFLSIHIHVLRTLLPIHSSNPSVLTRSLFPSHHLAIALSYILARNGKQIQKVVWTSMKTTYG